MTPLLESKMAKRANSSFWRYSQKDSDILDPWPEGKGKINGDLKEKEDRQKYFEVIFGGRQHRLNDNLYDL